MCALAGTRLRLWKGRCRSEESAALRPATATSGQTPALNKEDHTLKAKAPWPIRRKRTGLKTRHCKQPARMPSYKRYVASERFRLTGAVY